MNHRFNLLSLMILGMFILVAGCKKDNDDNNNNNPTPTPPPVTINSDPQVSFLLDGVIQSYVTGGLNSYSTYFSNSGGLNPFPDSSESVYGAGFENINTGAAKMDFYKGTFKYLVPSDSTAFTNFFPKQAIPYSVDAANGVEIWYYDDNGLIWSTGNGTANQTGSTFVITDRKPMKLGGDKYMKVMVSFNCKVYNETGGSKTITGGTAVLMFWADY